MLSCSHKRAVESDLKFQVGPGQSKHVPQFFGPLWLSERVDSYLKGYFFLFRILSRIRCFGSSKPSCITLRALLCCAFCNAVELFLIETGSLTLQMCVRVKVRFWCGRLCIKRLKWIMDNNVLSKVDTCGQMLIW